VEAKIRLVYSDQLEAKSVAEAISPDNVKTPRCLTVKTSRIGNSVVTLIKYEDDNLMTFMATIDDLLSCVSVAERALSTVRKFKPS